MLPLPAATTTLANTLETSQPVLNAFLPYGYMEIGIIIGALLIIFIIAIFRDAIFGMLEHIRASWAHRKVRKFDSSPQHRDSGATSKAIAEHNRFKRIMAGRNRISRFD
jgi:hypothetical protein